ncbi:hypothetical protein EUTSA_v10011530mg [Eutrema salsugineum]|uniref:C2 domain-containing protein n=1 Tax=Eutrema salsugineum TaxID=72664 RepID=V4JY41_EUTSA|nr:uncharacterized protein LOC18010961 [Eutrema salsugineum]ESQ30425.1 hypothetical protein EUTSA_v10011530mg [Eutrema salsugineum]
MESPQSVASDFNGIHLNGSGETITKKPVMSSDSDSFVGVLEVFVHQARDIHNICIYHKQDVYAKLCLTSDPESSLSTKIINGGGRNPVFDDTLQFDVKNLDCSLKCEIYMMSRVKNYLEDQLLGFTLVPLSEVIVRNGKLEKEFSLSSTDLFHSPAGFVELSLSYAGDSPEVMHIPPVPTVDETELAPIEFDEIEFLDPKIVCENNQMVSNYLASPCSDSDEFGSSETGFVEVNSVQSAVVDTVEEAAPTSTVLTNGISSPSVAVSSGSSSTHDDSKLSSEENNSGSDREVKKPTDAHDDSKLSSEENNSGSDREAKKAADTIKNDDLDKTDDEVVVKPVLSMNFEPEQKVVQQDIVDMYTKSLQQFTESLAKMKLPLDIDSPTQSENSSSSQQTPKSASSRVFYGSRAFF